MATRGDNSAGQQPGTADPAGRPGVHAISNASLDTPGPRRCAAAPGSPPCWPQPRLDPEDLLALLADRSIAPDDALPDTGVGREIGADAVPGVRRADAVRATQVYGTRCSTALLIRRDGQGLLVERSFAAGRPAERDPPGGVPGPGPTSRPEGPRRSLHRGTHDRRTKGRSHGRSGARSADGRGRGSQRHHPARSRHAADAAAHPGAGRPRPRPALPDRRGAAARPARGAGRLDAGHVRKPRAVLEAAAGRRAHAEDERHVQADDFRHADLHDRGCRGGPDRLLPRRPRARLPRAPRRPGTPCWSGRTSSSRPPPTSTSPTSGPAAGEA